MVSGKTDSPQQIHDPCQTEQATQKPRENLSMHDGIPVWYDCCSCEAEPYWTEAMEEPTNDK